MMTTIRSHHGSIVHLAHVLRQRREVNGAGIGVAHGCHLLYSVCRPSSHRYVRCIKVGGIVNRWRTSAVEEVFMLWVEIDGILFGDSDDFFDSFVNEDNGDQASEALLGKSRDVPHKRTEVKGHYKHDDNCCPDSRPRPERHVIPFLITTENYLKIKG